MIEIIKEKCIIRNVYIYYYKIEDKFVGDILYEYSFICCLSFYNELIILNSIV